MVRCERAGDREVIIKFGLPTCSAEELKLSEKRYKEASQAEEIPIGANITYASYVNTVEFDSDLDYYTELEMEINGCKKRTARGYALKDCAVKYIVESNKEVFDSLGIK